MIKASLIGIEEFKKEIQSASDKIKNEIDAEVMASAMEFVALAKRDLASEGARATGNLINSIQWEKESKNNYVVKVPNSAAPYAGFIEFGTKKKYTPQLGFEKEAAQFKGLRINGSIRLIEAIRRWVEIKGIASGKEADSAAFFIARSIRENGIPAVPFFYKQIPIVRTNLIKRVRNILDGI